RVNSTVIDASFIYPQNGPCPLRFRGMAPRKTGWRAGADRLPLPLLLEEEAMSRIFGEMRQIGIVVRDIDAAMKHWVEVCGVGPWFYAEKLPLTAFRYKGRASPIPHLSIALANSGEVQLELIQQRCRTPSLYWDFLDAGHEGMQHWSSWPVDFNGIRDRALRSGWQVGQ